GRFALWRTPRARSNWCLMISVNVEIRRYIDDSNPGWVECWLTDAHGQKWSFIEKLPIVTDAQLNERSQYPQPGIIACEIVERFRGADDVEFIVINTARPWGVESTNGETQFTIRQSQLHQHD